MNTKYKFLIFIPITFGLFLLFILFTWESNVEVLHPKGWVGLKERYLLVLATLVMLLVVIPVFMLAFLFPWKYRGGNLREIYTPDLAHNVFAEIIWWGLPFVIVLVLSVLTWKATHELDPYKPIEKPGTRPLTIQVIALQWKWLFIYPEQEIASVNYLQIPIETPLIFEITSDAPMNSFWIPELGGQIYAMPAMRSKLNLIANKTGTFYGVSANLSGDGFSGMHFLTKASSQAEFEEWVQDAKNSTNSLDRDEYNQIAKPSKENPVELYTLGAKDLFHQIIMKYMVPPKDEEKTGMKQEIPSKGK